LEEPYREQALAEIHRLVPSVDAFLVHSQSYADMMQAYFDLPGERIRIVPLGIDTRHFIEAAAAGQPGGGAARGDRAGGRSIGYLARLAPEKGLHLLIDAFLQLRQDPTMQDVRLEIAGWLGDHQREYAQTAFNRLRNQGLADAFCYHGTVDLDAKVRFLQGLDVFCVPTTYQEPKGLYVLEALAAGTPVVAPDHGAFPELLHQTGGGVLTVPGDPCRLAAALADLLSDSERRTRLGETGRQAVLATRNARAMAEATLAVFADYAGRDA
jgi:glycosyltransferase involved in cell wall biosynthesis